MAAEDLSDLRRRASESTPPAVIMGLSTAALGIARSLGRQRVAVVGVYDGDQPPPAAASRHLRAVRAPAVDDTAALLRFYERLGDRLGNKPVLLPTGDQNVLFIVQNRRRLSERFRFLLPGSLLLQRIASKASFLDLCAALDLPIPLTVVPDDETSLREAIPRLRFPCVVKPEFTHLWRTPAAARAGLGKAKALPVRHGDELLQCYRAVVNVSPHLIIQEMIIGPDANHESYCSLTDGSGQVFGEFVARKLRVAPPHYGMGCLVESVDSPDAIVEGRRVLGALNFRGFGGVQFKRDDRDGRLYLMELTIRFNVFTSLPPVCGVDFPFLFYQLCAGSSPVPAPPHRAGIVWLDSRADLLAMPTYIADGSWTRWAYFRSRRRASVSAYFTWNDPMPWVRQMVPVCRAATRRLPGLRRLRPARAQPPMS